MIFVAPARVKYVRKMFSDIDEFVTYHNVKIFDTDDEKKEEEKKKDGEQDERFDEMDFYR